jgi:hypothetical protein
VDTGGEQFHGRSSREISVEEEKACVTPATIRDEGSSGFETRGSYYCNKKLKLDDSLILFVPCGISIICYAILVCLLKINARKWKDLARCALDLQVSRL